MHDEGNVVPHDLGHQAEVGTPSPPSATAETGGAARSPTTPGAPPYLDEAEFEVPRGDKSHMGGFADPGDTGGLIDDRQLIFGAPAGLRYTRGPQPDPRRWAAGNDQV